MYFQFIYLCRFQTTTRTEQQQLSYKNSRPFCRKFNSSNNRT